jgi:hypothetical protein
VLREHGNFTVPTTPAGQVPPTGHILTVFVNRETGETTDLSLAENETMPPALSTLDAGAPRALE